MMEGGRGRRKKRPKYTVLDITPGQSKEVEEAKPEPNSEEAKNPQEKEEIIITKEESTSGKEDANGGGEVWDEDDERDDKWNTADEDEERGRKREKWAEYHLFVKTHQSRRHRTGKGSHRARSSS